MDDPKSLFWEAVSAYGRKQKDRTPAEMLDVSNRADEYAVKFEQMYKLRPIYGEARTITNTRFSLGGLIVELMPDIVIIHHGEPPKVVTPGEKGPVFRLVLQCRHCDFEVTQAIERPSENKDGLSCIGEAIHEANERFRKTEHICPHESPYALV